MKLLACFVAVMAGLTACTGGNQEISGPVGRIVEGLGDDAAPITATERVCLRQRLRTDPGSAPELRRVRHFDELGDFAQIRTLEALAPCIQLPLGRAVLRGFVAAIDGSHDDAPSFEQQARCISENPAASRWLVELRSARDGALVGSSLMPILIGVYLCARDVVVDGALTGAFDLDHDAASCLATSLEPRVDLVDEVATIVFGARTLEPSPELERLITSCRG